MNYQEADQKLRGRCYSTRKLANNTYLKRRDWGSTKAIAVQLHSTDIITFHEDGKVEVNTGGWDTITTRDRINRYLNKPWHVFGERGATILSNYRWYAGQDDYKRTGSAEVVLSNRATILPDGEVDGGDSAEEYREQIRQQDNDRNRLRSRLAYWVRKARTKTSCKLTIADIANEENAQIRSAKIAAFGLERYFLEAGAETLQIDGEYSLLRIKLDQWNNMTVLKMVCPSTQAAYVCPVEPRTQTIDEALDFMFGVENYREQLIAES